MNVALYPWLSDLSSPEAQKAIKAARESYETTGAAIFHEFLTREGLTKCRNDARAQEDTAFTTDDTHTSHQLQQDPAYPPESVRNHLMRTKVASIAMDELPKDSELTALYRHATLRKLVASIVKPGKELFLSEDALGACSINVFRPSYYHAFHFDESEFSTTLMLQAGEQGGLFQYTHPLRASADDLAMDQVAAALKEHAGISVTENDEDRTTAPVLHTLDFLPGTLSIFSGSRSLHRVTRVDGDQSRLVAVLTFASEPHFKNSAEVQNMFWGRTVQ